MPTLRTILRTSGVFGAVFLAVSVFIGPAVANPPAPGRPGVERPGVDRPPGERRDAREQALLEAVQRTDPERYRKMMEVRAARPRLYRAVIGQAALTLRSREEDPGAVPRFAKIVDECHTLHTLLVTWEGASEQAKVPVRRDIEASVGRLFDLRQEARRAQIVVMEARLQRLRSEVAARDVRKKELVDTFTKAMLGAEGDPGF
jgi:hypothetical protein